MQNCKVLLADDFEADIVTYKHYLTKDPDYRYECYSASSGKEAIDSYMALKPDCLVLDYKFGDMTGLEVLEKLQELTGDDALPVLIISGSGSQKIALQALRQGAQDYSIKCDITINGMSLLIQNTILKSQLANEVRNQKEQLAIKNQELERSNFDLGMFAHTACNELNEPIKLMLAGLNSLQAHQNPDGLKKLSLLQKTGHSMQTYVSGLLDWAEVRYHQPHFEVFDLKTLAESVAQELTEREFNFTTIEEVRVVGEGTVEADQTQVRQLIKQLVMDATVIQDDRQTASVELAISSDPYSQEVTLSAYPLGQKMASENQREASEAFNGSDHLLSSRIGQTISNIILNNHKGHISTDSSTLSITLPRSQRNSG